LNRNRIKHLYGPTNDLDASGRVIGQSEKDDPANRWFIGRDLNVVWDQKVLGVWQQSEAAEAAKYGVAPGDFKVEDVNGDGRYTDADRQFLGYTTPRFQWSFRNEFNLFQNFDLSFLIYSNWGQMASYNQAKNNSGFPNRQNAYVLPYWTPENPINDYARLFSSNGGASFSVYRKTSFIRLQNIALSYNLPSSLVSKAHFKSIKVYANITNVGVYAPDWDFWDPEYRNRDSNGAISTAISPRYYTFGLNLTL
ncbi:MAG: SusC/RagA family TonB-linked outer membrane protein, partial [Mucilaginibacter polytrichastri]|nr:SusC/RagA family TonB-linked outer membrane protein [Mucilaginibacter polytrichastri]